MNKRQIKRLACGFAAGLLRGGLSDAGSNLTLKEHERLENAVQDLAKEMLRRSGEKEYPIDTNTYFAKNPIIGGL